MPKYYKKKFRGSKDKYSVEQSAQRLTVNAGANINFLIVPATGVQGMRKVKHLTISMANSDQESELNALYWALVYVPQGTAPGILNVGTSATTSLYEPNQFVLSCGVVDFSAGPQRIRTPLARNLNSGDAIYLLLANPSATVNANVDSVVRYAITLK